MIYQKFALNLHFGNKKSGSYETISKIIRLYVWLANCDPAESIVVNSVITKVNQGKLGYI